MALHCLVSEIAREILGSSDGNCNRKSKKSRDFGALSSPMNKKFQNKLFYYVFRTNGTFAQSSSGAPIGAEKSTQTFLVQSFSTTLRVMDVRAENRGRPRQKVRFPAAPVMGRNFLTPGHPGVRVRNVRGKSGPKSLCLCCFFLP